MLEGSTQLDKARKIMEDIAGGIIRNTGDVSIIRFIENTSEVLDEDKHKVTLYLYYVTDRNPSSYISIKSIVDFSFENQIQLLDLIKQEFNNEIYTAVDCMIRREPPRFHIKEDFFSDTLPRISENDIAKNVMIANAAYHLTQVKWDPLEETGITYSFYTKVADYFRGIEKDFSKKDDDLYTWYDKQIEEQFPVTQTEKKD